MQDAAHPGGPKWFYRRRWGTQGVLQDDGRGAVRAGVLTGYCTPGCHRALSRRGTKRGYASEYAKGYPRRPQASAAAAAAESSRLHVAAVEGRLHEVLCCDPAYGCSRLRRIPLRAIPLRAVPT